MPLRLRRSKRRPSLSHKTILKELSSGSSKTLSYFSVARVKVMTSLEVPSLRTRGPAIFLPSADQVSGQNRLEASIDGILRTGCGNSFEVMSTNPQPVPNSVHAIRFPSGDQRAKAPRLAKCSRPLPSGRILQIPQLPLRSEA